MKAVRFWCLSRDFLDARHGQTFVEALHEVPSNARGDEMAEKTQIMGSTPVEEEPLYGLTYLPRKFKAGATVRF